MKSEYQHYINLQKASLKKLRAFINVLVSENITDSWFYFDKLDCRKSFARQPDPNMAFDKFLPNITKKSISKIVIGFEEYLPGSYQKIDTISMLIRGVELSESPDIERFFWYFCPLNDHNYQKFDNIFTNTYGININEF